MKIKIGLMYGGKSCEHEVSIRSAKSIKVNLDKNKYEIIDILVDKNGKFKEPASKVDVYFPIIHGTGGEDGKLQGYFEIKNIAYVGADVLGSAIGFDKDVQKRLLRDAGIKIANFVVLHEIDNINKVLKKIKLPIFIKPSNSGSSVGVTKVESKNRLLSAAKDAFQFDTKIIVEECIIGREIEVSVIGGSNPIASVIGEIIPQNKHKFYDYEAKYIDDKGAKLIIPSKLDIKLQNEIQNIAIKTFKILECYGLARVDMFLTNKNEIVVNEINTLPGFTSVSMYPKLLEASGFKYSEILDRLIELAIERKRQKDSLKYDYFK